MKRGIRMTCNYERPYAKNKKLIKDLAEYILKTECTVRATGDHFCMSKSTVHKLLVYNLAHYDKKLFIKVKKVLSKNKAERHMRGGLATKKKYADLRVS